MIILIYKVLAPPRTFHDNYSQAYGGNNLRDSSHLVEKKLFITNHSTNPCHGKNA